MVRTCKLCGAPFEAQNNAQGYCSRDCVREARLAAGGTRTDAGGIPTFSARAPGGEVNVPYTPNGEPRADYAGSAPTLTRDAPSAGAASARPRGCSALAGGGTRTAAGAMWARPAREGKRQRPGGCLPREKARRDNG